jgi:hypothetical protein
VHLDAWPGSREFPVPEMEAKGRKAHIGEVSRSPVAIDVPRNFRCWAQTRIVCPGAPASFNSFSENALARKDPCSRGKANRHWIRERP